MTTYDTYRELLDEFIAIPSISTDPAQAGAMKDTAAWLQQLFEKNGFVVTILQGKNSNPVVVAKYDAGYAKTTMIYGHYDVQPAELSQGWTGDPFLVREKAGRLIGRGVVDNKGQVLVHIVSVFEHIAAGTLASNIVFMIEGNEETGNSDLPELLSQNKQLLSCDDVLVSDGEMVGDAPTLDVSLRGGFNMRANLRTAPNDMHSGLVGGGVPNAAQELIRLVGRIHDEKGGVRIEGFYEGVAKPNSSQLTQHKELMSRYPPEKTLGLSKLLSANNTDFYTQTGLFPTIQVSGLDSGYTGEGFANIVPAVAEARLNVRTVAGQNTQGISELVRQYIVQTAPGYAELSVEVSDVHEAVLLSTDSPVAQRALSILREVYGKKPILQHAGGAIPIVLDFKQVLGIMPLLAGLGNDDSRIHGPDENFRIDLIQKGLEFSRRFFASGSGNKDEQVE